MKSVYKIFTLGLLALASGSQITAGMPPMTQLRNILNTPASIANLQPIYNLLQNPPRNGYGNLPNLFTEKYGIASTSLTPALIAQVQAVNTALTAYPAVGGRVAPTDAQIQAVLRSVEAIGEQSDLFRKLFGANGVAIYTDALNKFNATNALNAGTAGQAPAAIASLTTLYGAPIPAGTTLQAAVDLAFSKQVRNFFPRGADLTNLVALVKPTAIRALPTTALTPASTANYATTQTQALAVIDRAFNAITDSAALLNNPTITPLTGIVPADNLKTQVQKAVTAITNTEAALVANAGTFALPAGTLNARANALLTHLTAGGGVHGATLTGIDTYLTDLPKNPTSLATNLTDAAFNTKITNLLGAGGLAIGQAGIRDILASPSLGLAGAVAARTTDAKLKAVIEAFVMELEKTFDALTKADGYPAIGNPAGSASNGIAVIANREINRLNLALDNARRLAGGGVITTANDAQIVGLKNSLIATLGGKLADCTAGNLDLGAGVNVGNLIAVINQMKDALAALSPVGVPAAAVANGNDLANAIRTHIRGTVAPAIPAALYTPMANPTLAPFNGTALGNLATLTLDPATRNVINVTDWTLAPGYTAAEFEAAAQKAFGSLWLILDAIDTANQRIFNKDLQAETIPGATAITAPGTVTGCTAENLTDKATSVIGALQRKIGTLERQIAPKDTQIATLTAEVARLTAQLAAATAGGGAGPAVDPVTAYNTAFNAAVAQIAAFWPGFGGTLLLPAQAGLEASAAIPRIAGLGTSSLLANYYQGTTTNPTVFGLSLGLTSPARVGLRSTAVKNMIIANMPWAEIFRLQAAAPQGAKTFVMTPNQATLMAGATGVTPNALPDDFSLSVTP